MVDVPLIILPRVVIGDHDHGIAGEMRRCQSNVNIDADHRRGSARLAPHLIFPTRRIDQNQVLGI